MTSRRSRRPDRSDENDMGPHSVSWSTHETMRRNADGNIRPTLAGRMLRPAPLLVAAAALALGAAASVASSGLSSARPPHTSLPRSEASSKPGGSSHNGDESDTPSPSAGPLPRAGATAQAPHGKPDRHAVITQPCGTRIAALWTLAKPSQRRSGHDQTPSPTALKTIEHEHELIVQALSTIQGMQGQLKQAAGLDSQQLAQTAEKLCARDKSLAGQAGTLQHLLATVGKPVSTPKSAGSAKAPATGHMVSADSPAARGSALPRHDVPGNDQAKPKELLAVSADVGTTLAASPAGSAVRAAPVPQAHHKQAAPTDEWLNPLPGGNADPVTAPVNCADPLSSCDPQQAASPVPPQTGCPPLNRPLTQTCPDTPCPQPDADGVTTSGEAPVAATSTPQAGQNPAAISDDGIASTASGCGTPAPPPGIMTCLVTGTGQDSATATPPPYRCRPLRPSPQDTDTPICVMNPFAPAAMPAASPGEEGLPAFLSPACEPLSAGFEPSCFTFVGLPGMTC